MSDRDELLVLADKLANFAHGFANSGSKIEDVLYRYRALRKAQPAVPTPRPRKSRLSKRRHCPDCGGSLRIETSAQGFPRALANCGVCGRSFDYKELSQLRLRPTQTSDLEARREWERRESKL